MTCGQLLIEAWLPKQLVERKGSLGMPNHSSPAATTAALAGHHTCPNSLCSNVNTPVDVHLLIAAHMLHDPTFKREMGEIGHYPTSFPLSSFHSLFPLLPLPFLPLNLLNSSPT